MKSLRLSRLILLTRIFPAQEAQMHWLGRSRVILSEHRKNSMKPDCHQRKSSTILLSTLGRFCSETRRWMGHKWMDKRMLSCSALALLVNTRAADGKCPIRGTNGFDGLDFTLR